MPSGLRKAKGSPSSSKRTHDHTFPSCAQTYATLLIFHAAMQPEQIAAVLGLEPDQTARRGDAAALGRKVPRNLWAKGTYDRFGSRDARFHVDKILDELRGKEARLRLLLKRGCEIAITCFWESASGNGGPELDAGFLKRLAQFPVSLGFDIWLDVPGKPKREKAGRSLRARSKRSAETEAGREPAGARRV